MYEIIIKICLSVFLGGLVGLERKLRDKPAGFRTNSIIALGSCVFSIVSLEIGNIYDSDPQRIAAQIVTGIGFLGAGVIMREGIKVSGLTTAAGIWLVASIGMCIGFGFYYIAIFVTFIAIMLQLIMRNTGWIATNVKAYETIHIVCNPSSSVVEKIHSIITEEKAKIDNETISKQQDMLHLKIIVHTTEKGLKTIINKLIRIKDIRTLEN